MLFNVELDAGTYILGYVVPDAFGVHPSIRVVDDGMELLTMEANESRESLVIAGRHSTGRCGFRLDENLVPGLSHIENLELYDAGTNLLIYRRRHLDSLLHLKVFRLETHLLPLWRLDNYLEDKFQFWYPNADRLGRETATQLLLLNGANSCYISGRLLYKNYEYFLNDSFKIFTILRDPFDELAERLLFLSSFGEPVRYLLGDRELGIFEPLIAALSELQSLGEAELRRFFKRAPPSLIAALANPQIRQLTTNTPDEMPSPGSLASALETLSAFSVTGLRSEPAYCKNALADSLGLDPGSIPEVDEFPLVQQLGNELRPIRLIEGFLEKDLELYHHISQAFQKMNRYEPGTGPDAGVPGGVQAS